MKKLRLLKNLNCGKFVLKAENARGHILRDITQNLGMNRGSRRGSELKSDASFGCKKVNGGGGRGNDGQ